MKPASHPSIHGSMLMDFTVTSMGAEAPNLFSDNGKTGDIASEHADALHGRRANTARVPVNFMIC